MSPERFRSGQPLPVPGPEPDEVVVGPERSWFFGEEGRPAGPVPEGVLRRMLRTGELAPATRVWSDGMAAWVPAFVVSDLVPGAASALEAESLGAWSPRTRLARRVAARSIDTLLAVAAGAFCGVSLAALTDAPHWPLYLAGGALAGPLLGAFLEAATLTRWGTSPGKALLALRVRTERQARPELTTAARRSLLVWWRGLAAGVPVLVPFSAGAALTQLRRRGVAPWDRATRLVVEQRAFRAARQGLVIEESTR